MFVNACINLLNWIELDSSFFHFWYIYIYQIIVKLLIDFIIFDIQKYDIDIKRIDFAYYILFISIYLILNFLVIYKHLNDKTM